MICGLSSVLMAFRGEVPPRGRSSSPRRSCSTSSTVRSPVRWARSHPSGCSSTRSQTSSPSGSLLPSWSTPGRCRVPVMGVGRCDVLARLRRLPPGPLQRDDRPARRQALLHRAAQPGAAGVVIATVFAIDKPLEAAACRRSRPGVVPAALMATSFGSAPSGRSSPRGTCPSRSASSRPSSSASSSHPGHRHRRRLRLRPHRAPGLAHRSAPSALAGARTPSHRPARGCPRSSCRSRWIERRRRAGDRRGRGTAGPPADDGDEVGGDIEGDVSGGAR